MLFFIEYVGPVISEIQSTSAKRNLHLLNDTRDCSLTSFIPGPHRNIIREGQTLISTTEKMSIV